MKGAHFIWRFLVILGCPITFPIAKYVIGNGGDAEAILVYMVGPFIGVAAVAGLGIVAANNIWGIVGLVMYLIVCWRVKASNDEI